MGVEIILGILASVISLTLGGLVPLLEKLVGPRAQQYFDNNPESNFSRFLNLIFHLEKNRNLSYNEKISNSLDTLKKATQEIDNVIEEITIIGKEKQLTIEKLEKELEHLSNKEIELKQKIETMEKVPVEAIDQFERIINKGDKRGARRDYVLFASGVLLSTIVSLILYYLTINPSKG